MSKTLSNGILSLRFMQNAQRAKQLKEVKLHRAEVVDEGKWEVSQAIREAWGLTNERNEDQDTDVHEASYLPFLYPPSDNDLSSTTTGRRVFKQTSFDVNDDNGEDTQANDAPVASTSNSPPKPSKGRIHAHPRPISISSLSKGKATLLKGFDQLSGNDADTKTKQRKQKGKETQATKSTARELVFESGNVGVDLRDQASTKATPRFLKPAGVDDPQEATSSPEKISLEVGAQIIDGARQKPKKTKRKRDQDDEDDKKEVTKKSKKKKKKSDSRG